MATGFAEGIHGNKSTVVTRGAIGSRPAVIHLHRTERHEVGVACFAGRRGRHMVRRLAQARASRLMTIRTLAILRPICVIERCNSPGRR